MIIPFSAEHIVRKSQFEIDQLCRPMFKKLGLNYFHYARFYKDGSLMALYNRMDWHDFFYTNNFRTAVPLPNQQIQYGKYNLCLWRGVLSDRIVNDARNFFNFDHPLGISIAHHNYFESFAFGTHQGNDSIINTYFNELESLIKFTKDFKLRSADLILKAEQEKIILPKSFQANELQILNKIPKFHEIKGNLGHTKITLKEMQILQMICEGFTVREIAVVLSRSARTIETHVNNLKLKLGASKKARLIEIAIKNGIKF